jgi:metal-sulfur cluster biosynthetic enzyme
MSTQLTNDNILAALGTVKDPEIGELAWAQPAPTHHT